LGERKRKVLRTEYPHKKEGEEIHSSKKPRSDDAFNMVRKQEATGGWEKAENKCGGQVVTCQSLVAVDSRCDSVQGEPRVTRVGRVPPDSKKNLGLGVPIESRAYFPRFVGERKNCSYAKVKPGGTDENPRGRGDSIKPELLPMLFLRTKPRLDKTG